MEKLNDITKGDIADTDIAKFRSELDSLDKTLIESFTARMKIVKQISKIKLAKNLPVFDRAREEKVINDRLKYVTDDKLIQCTREFIESILVISKKEQRKFFSDLNKTEEEYTVAYQGIPGSYSHQAVMQYFKENYNSTPYPAFADVFTALANSRADYGVLPLENSSTGSITAVYDLLIRYGCYITGEEIVAVNHCLLGLPDSTIEDVDTVFSHEQGFMQCRNYLTNYNWEQREYKNTAISAEYVSKSGNKNWAAIASRAAAEFYGLKILKEDIQNEKNNFTRFIVVSPNMYMSETCNKSSICFVLKHESGSLANILNIFAKYKLNLMKLESRPILGEPWNYRFYADIESNKTALENAFSELSQHCDDWRFLGSYRSVQIKDSL